VETPVSCGSPRNIDGASAAVATGTEPHNQHNAMTFRDVRMALLAAGAGRVRTVRIGTALCTDHGGAPLDTSPLIGLPVLGLPSDRDS
jgi:hypothetical protein